MLLAWWGVRIACMDGCGLPTMHAGQQARRDLDFGARCTCWNLEIDFAVLLCGVAEGNLLLVGTGVMSVD